MAKDTTLLGLSQLVDLSINCQEGIVNYQALHILLNVLIQQSALTEVIVEFRGDDSKKIQALVSTSKPTTALYPEYTISGPKAKKKITKRISLQDVIAEKDKLEEKKEKEIRVIDRRKQSTEDPDPHPLPLKSPQGSYLGLTPGGAQTVVLVDSQSSLPQFSVAMSKNTLDEMRNEILDIKNQVKELIDLPSNLGLLEAAKSKSTPILDMFQILTITKRMDATETALEKVGSLLEDLARKQISTSRGHGGTESSATAEGYPSGAGSAADDGLEDKITELREVVEKTGSIGSRKSFGSGRNGKSSNYDSRISNLEEAVANIEDALTNQDVGIKFQRYDSPGKSQKKSIGGKTSGGAKHKKPPVKKQAETIPEEGNNESSEELRSGRPTPSKKKETSTGQDDSDGSEGSESKSKSKKEEKIAVWSPVAAYENNMEGVDLSTMSPQEALTLVQEEFNKFTRWVTESIQEKAPSEVLNIPGGFDINTEQLDKKFQEYTQKMEEMNALYNNQIGILSQQFTGVQNEIQEVVHKLEVVLPGGDSTGINAETTLDLANKLQLLEQEIVSISEVANKLGEEKTERDKQTEAILEQIDVLKIVKANREDLEDALGDKADACMINRKVSHDQFDAACDDLSRGIETALSKLEEQTEMWQQALNSIQREVGNKLDKLEVDPLRDFVNSKLKALQEKFKSLTALKREQEAAGSKSKLLRNVNCISCDKDVVMRKEMDISLKPKAYAMPPSRNMAPYLAYELDQLRKQQKCVPGSKNLNFIETALKTRGNKDQDHICNRYCGGSHTVMTPQQRVTRLGHFLDQWGPEIAPLQDEYIRGKDKQMYKARDENKKPNNKPRGGRPGKDIPIQESELPQQDTFVDPIAQEAIMNEEGVKRNSLNRKLHNIGSVVVDTQGEAPEN